jgi:hypothetical protein
MTFFSHSDFLAIDPSLQPSQLIADAVKRSTKAHLFHFYSIFCEIVAIPRRMPLAWVMAEASNPVGSKTLSDDKNVKAITHRNSISTTASSGKVVELDSRQLAKDCLKELAQEIGIAY